jgi:hypothetical protein
VIADLPKSSWTAETQKAFRKQDGSTALTLNEVNLRAVENGSGHITVISQ